MQDSCCTCLGICVKMIHMKKEIVVLLDQNKEVKNETATPMTSLEPLIRPRHPQRSRHIQIQTTNKHNLVSFRRAEGLHRFWPISAQDRDHSWTNLRLIRSGSWIYMAFLFILNKTRTYAVQCCETWRSLCILFDTNRNKSTGACTNSRWSTALQSLCLFSSLGRVLVCSIVRTAPCRIWKDGGLNIAAEVACRWTSSLSQDLKTEIRMVSLASSELHTASPNSNHQSRPIACCPESRQTPDRFPLLVHYGPPVRLSLLFANLTM